MSLEATACCQCCIYIYFYIFQAPLIAISLTSTAAYLIALTLTLSCSCSTEPSCVLCVVLCCVALRCLVLPGLNWRGFPVVAATSSFVYSFGFAFAFRADSAPPEQITAACAPHFTRTSTRLAPSASPPLLPPSITSRQTDRHSPSTFHLPPSPFHFHFHFHLPLHPPSTRFTAHRTVYRSCRQYHNLTFTLLYASLINTVSLHLALLVLFFSSSHQHRNSIPSHPIQSIPITITITISTLNPHLA